MNFSWQTRWDFIGKTKANQRFPFRRRSGTWEFNVDMWIPTRRPGNVDFCLYSQGILQLLEWVRHWKINGTSTEHHLRKRSKIVTPIATFAIPKGPKGSGRLDDWKSKLRRTGPPARPQKRKSSNRCNDISLFPQVVSQGSLMNFPMANPFRKLLNPLEKQTKINIPKSPRGISHTKFEIPCTATSSERKSLIYLYFSNEISTRSPTEIHEIFMGHHLRKQWKIVS